MTYAFQTLSELEKRKGDDNDAAEDDPARLQELRDHLLRLGAAESKLVGYKEHNGVRIDQIPESNGVTLPASSSSPLDREQRQGVIDILRVSDKHLMTILELYHLRIWSFLRLFRFEFILLNA